MKNINKKRSKIRENDEMSFKYEYSRKVHFKAVKRCDNFQNKNPQIQYQNTKNVLKKTNFL